MCTCSVIAIKQGRSEGLHMSRASACRIACRSASRHVAIYHAAASRAARDYAEQNSCLDISALMSFATKSLIDMKTCRVRFHTCML